MCVGTARQLDGSKHLNMTISPELHSAIHAKAEAMQTDFCCLVEVLLRFGLEVQNRREAEIATLTEQLRNSDDPQVHDRTAEELGRAIFSR